MDLNVLKKLLIAVIMVVFLAITHTAFAETNGPVKYKREWQNYDISGTAEIEVRVESGEVIPINAPGGSPFRMFYVETTGYSPSWLQWPTGRYNFDSVPMEKVYGSFLRDPLSHMGAHIMLNIANLLFIAAKAVTKLGITILVMAFNTSFTTFFADFIQKTVQSLFLSDQSLFSLFLLIGVIALTIIGTLKILRGQVTSALTSLIIAVVAVGSVFFFSANVGNVVKGVVGITDGVTNTVLNSLARATLDEWRDEKGKSMNLEGIEIENRGVIAVSDVAWQAIIVNPWRYSLFGTCKKDDLKITTKEDIKDGYGKSEMDVLEGYKGDFGNDAFEIVRKIQKERGSDTLILATLPGSREREIAMEALGMPGIERLHGFFKETTVYHGNHPGSCTGMNPGNASNHVAVAFFSLIPAFGFALLAIMVGGSIIIYQLLIVVMLIFFPFILFALLIPDAGWNVAVKYGRTLLGFLAVKLIYGIYLALVLAVLFNITTVMLNAYTK